MAQSRSVAVGVGKSESPLFPMFWRYGLAGDRRRIRAGCVRPSVSRARVCKLVLLAVAVQVTRPRVCESAVSSCDARSELERLEGAHCLGLALDVDASITEASCAEACCADLACEVWQYHPSEGCFRGRHLVCHHGASGFAERARGARLRPSEVYGAVQTFGDPRNYNALEAVEPYLRGPQEVRLDTDNGDTLLARRFGPKDGAPRCWDNDAARERCCRFGAAIVDQQVGTHAAYDVFVDITSSLSDAQRRWFHAALPRVEIDEQVFDSISRRWRVGLHAPHRICASEGVEEDVEDIASLRSLIRAIGDVADPLAPLSRTFVNVGAGACGRGDPLFELLHSAEGRGFRGLVVDVEASKLARCVQDAEESKNGVQVIPLEMIADPLTVADMLAPHLDALFGHASSSDSSRQTQRQARNRWPIDVVAVDIDGCDCPVLRELLELIQPKLVILELAFHIPPPFRFSLQCGPGSTEEWLRNYNVDHFNAASGCSLSYAVHALAPYGMHLLRLAQQDAVFVHSSVADVFEHHFGSDSAGNSLRFPQDEFGCYRKSKLWMQLPAEYIREWFFSSHPSHVFGRIWSNLSFVSRMYGRKRSPFTLDF